MIIPSFTSSLPQEVSLVLIKTAASFNHSSLNSPPPSNQAFIPSTLKSLELGLNLRLNFPSKDFFLGIIFLIGILPQVPIPCPSSTLNFHSFRNFSIPSAPYFWLKYKGLVLFFP